METTTKNIVDTTIAQSSPFATGGGGVSFEISVQSFFLLLLIVRGVSPVINDTVASISYQTGRCGYRTDDLLVVSDRKKKLICQIKHKITIGKSSKDFVETIQRAWDDFFSPQFVQGNDYICLATAIISAESITAMRFINQQALESSSSEDFLRRIEQTNFSNKTNFTRLTIIRDIIDEHLKTRKVTDDELWRFCQSFVVLVFDLDYINSINRVLCQSMMLQHTHDNVSLVWSHLFRWSAYFNQIAKEVTYRTLPDEMIEYFGGIISTDEQEADHVGEKASEQLGILSVIGAWDDNNPFDRKFISNVFAKPYQDVRQELRTTYGNHEDIVSFQYGIWKVHHRTAALYSSVQYLSEDQVKTLYQLIGQVLSNTSHHIEKKNEREFLSFSSSAFDHSSLLRDGIVKGLCLLSNLESPPKHWHSNLLQNTSYVFIDGLFAEEDWKRWASINEYLHQLAEINPEAYLRNLEKYISDYQEDAMRLVADDVDLFSTNYIPPLIWSLEVLAWSEEYLIRSVLCLGQIASFDNIDKQGNNPINSIVSILLPWHPQTLASVDKRKNTLQSLHLDHPDVAWKVILKLLPLSTESTTGTVKPKYFLHDIPEHIDVDEAQMNLLYQTYITLVVQWAGNNPSQIAELLKHSFGFPNKTKKDLLNRLNKIVHEFCQEDKYSLWIELLRIKYRIMRNNLNNKATDASLPEYYTDLEKLIEHAEPEDIRVRYRRYFLNNDPQFNYLYLCDEEPWNARIKHQSESVKEIYLQFDAEEVYYFAKGINDFNTVGGILGKFITADDISAQFNHAFETADRTTFTQYVLSEYVRVHGIESLTNTGFLSLEKEKSAKLLMFVALSKEVMDFVEREFGNEESLVWKNSHGSWELCINESDSVRKLAEKISKSGRNRYIISQLDIWPDKYNFFSNDELITILIEAAREKNDALDTYEVRNLIELLQSRKDIDKQKLAAIEYMYLKVFDPYEVSKPKALPYVLSNDPNEFCSFIKTVYKKHHRNETQIHETESEKSPQMIEQSFDVLNKVHFIPGIDWNGDFDEKAFEAWIDAVEKWSKENDRFEITMRIVGENLSYSQTDENGMPHLAIMKTLNKATNDSMRRGYFIGVVNQRGACFVDPEGKPEDALADMFAQRASYAESLGYARFADVFHRISESYRSGAEWSRKYSKAQMEQEDE